jgi:acetyl esterase/lipase
MNAKSSLNLITLSISFITLSVLGGKANADDGNRQDHGNLQFPSTQQCTCTQTPVVIPGEDIPPTPTPGFNYCTYSAPFPNYVYQSSLESWLPERPANFRIVYDQTNPSDTSFGDLRLPEGDPPLGGWPVVVYIHGGGWTVNFPLDYAAPFLEKLTEQARVATWNLEFRRIGNTPSAGSLAGDGATASSFPALFSSGGWPNTFLDVGKGTDYLRTIAPTYNLNLNRVIVMGHSSGGHLAAWVAARPKLPPTADLYVPDPLPVIGVVGQEGKYDLAAEILGGRTDVYELLGTKDLATLAIRYAEASPIDLLPLGVPERLIVGALEPSYIVFSNTEFTAAARAAGDDVRVVLEQGRAGVWDDLGPNATGWPTEIGAVLSLLEPDRKLPGCAGASWPND